jgi:TRAP-type C4-dicarboxylate transport system substrate-binding protein
MSLLFTLMPACAPAYTPENPLVIDYESWLPATIPEYKELEKFFKGLEDATGGAVKTEFHMAGAMGKPTEAFERVLAGVSDIARINPGYTPGVFPMFGIFDYPIRFPSAEVMTQAKLEMYRKGYFDKDFAEVKTVASYSISPYVLFSKKKVTTLKDFEGLKIRCPSEGFVAVTKALGGVPVAKPSVESYINLQKGIVDADWQPWDGVFVYKLNEVTNYVTELLLMTSNHIRVMNKDTWKALPKAGKDYINENWEEFSLASARPYEASAVAAKGVFLKTPGREVVHLVPGEWEKIDPLFAPIWGKWIADMEAKGFPAKKAVDDLYRIMTDLGVEKPLIGYTPQ